MVSVGCILKSCFVLIWLVCSSARLQQHAVANTTTPLSVDCNFGVGSYLSNNYSFQTSSSSLVEGSSRRCKICNNVVSAITRITLDSDDDTVQSIFAIVLDDVDVRFVTEADSEDFQGNKAYHFHACPPLYSSESTELTTVFFSTPDNGSYTIKIEVDEKDINSGETRSVEVRNDGLAEVLAFDVKDEDLYKLLELSASSESEDVVYYLFVSMSCALVQAQHVHFPSNNQSTKVIKLTFSRFGRITLSQFSHPKISPGRWYIGIQIKDAIRGSGSKANINISMEFTYSYASMGKALPALYMAIISIIGGIGIAVFAHFFLNSDFEKLEPIVSPDNCSENNIKKKYNVRLPRSSFRSYLPEPLLRKSCPLRTWAKVIGIYWWGKGIKTFSYTTGVLAFAFGVGSAQFVIARWSNMIEAGNRDLCYYNEKCYRPIAIADIPSNFMLSNVPYVIHGLLLATSFSFREAICADHWYSKNRHQVSFNDAGRKMPYNFSVAYSFSWALIFEGLFSAIYHLCPSRLTFQFDSAFMFIISGLVVVALYNSHVAKTDDHSEGASDVPDGLLFSSDSSPAKETPIQAPKYFLFFVSPLLLLNYIGSVRDTTGLPVTFEVIYWIVLVMWILALYIWTYEKLGLEFSRECLSDAGLLVKWFFFLLFPICLVAIGFSQHSDWSQFFLFSCVAATSLSILGLMFFDVVVAHRRFKAAGHSVGDFFSSLFHPKKLCLSFISNLHRIGFIVVTFLFWVFAMYFFKLKPTAKKTAEPHLSRTFNKDCVLWDFFDYHDIWHMLSSFALFMSAYLLIYVTRKVEKVFWAETRYWRSKNQKYCDSQALGDSQQIPQYGTTGSQIILLDNKHQLAEHIVVRREKEIAFLPSEVQWKRESLV